jgi:RNA polymerase sigma factor (sigma-70 family)
MSHQSASLNRIRRAVLANATPVTDRQLLARFAGGDQDAFATLVRRHSGMVLGVCRRALANPADAEDACQATFVILARKAKGRWQESVANWLFATARRVASDSRRAQRRRGRRERQAAVAEAVTPLDQITGRELLAILDEELARLSERYREPLVLYYLEELSRDEIAARLGVPAGTVKIRLERGRMRLGDALTKRGAALGAGLLALAATSRAGAFPPRLIDTILAAARGEVSPAVAALAREAAVNSTVSRIKLIAIVALGATLLASGFAALAPIAAESPKAAPKDGGGKPRRSPAAAEGDERTISGKVLDSDGKPIVAELVMSWAAGQQESLGKTQADGSFRVTIPLREHGGWLTARAAGHGFDFTNVGRGKETPDDVTLRLPKEQPLRGRVIDPQGKPLAGIRVSADSLICYDGDSLTKHLTKWTNEFYGMGIPPGGDRSMWFRANWPGIVERESPVAATTDADGRFELAGVGVGQQIGLTVRGPGLARTEVSVINRPGFDPKPWVESADKNATVTPGRPGRFARLFGPDPQIIAEREKVVRGRVTANDTGKPMAGVPVAVEIRERLAYPSVHRGVTDKDGRYEIHGARKHGKYIVEVQTDPGTGYFSGYAEADDTAGYTPIDVDVQCWRGVVVSGTVTEKGSGKPIPQVRVWREPIKGNPLAKQSPTSVLKGDVRTDREGHFRFVTVPGQVLVQALISRGPNGEVYQPAKPDATLARDFVPVSDAKWSRLVEFKVDEVEVKLAIEIERAPEMTVKVVDADGKPLLGAYATGLSEEYWDHVERQQPDTNSLTIYNVEPGQERLLVAVDAKRRLVGTQVVKADDKEPVVKLGPGCTASGRVVDAEGQPIAGMTVHLYFTRREVTEACEPLNANFEWAMRTGRRDTVTDANGAFRFDALFPGQEFRMVFSKGRKWFGPEYNKAAKHAIVKHGDVMSLGDLKIEPRERIQE